MRKNYGEFIEKLEPDCVFTFGSNHDPKTGVGGFHGAGSAGFASFGRAGNVWREEGYDQKPNGWKGKWNVKGIGEGLQEGSEGKSYALPTVTGPGQKRSLSEDQIMENIQRMYECARSHPELEFLVAYSAVGNKPNLCGYTHETLAGLFRSAGEIPGNVTFSGSYTKLIFGEGFVSSACLGDKPFLKLPDIFQ